MTGAEVAAGLATIGIVLVIGAASLKASPYGQLKAVAKIVGNDLSFGRKRAIVGRCSCRFIFNVKRNEYRQELACDKAASRPRSGSLELWTTALSELPTVSGDVRLAAVRAGGADATEIEFGPSGQLTGGKAVEIWLTYGAGQVQRWWVIPIDPAKGPMGRGRFENAGPGAVTSP